MTAAAVTSTTRRDGPSIAAPTLLGAWVRRLVWQLVFALSGGMSARGRLPQGGCVVVANHSSHADSAALIAALDARHRPAVAAAADHWFMSRLRSVVCRCTVSGFPVRRSGGGMADLRQALPLLAAGHAVVVFAEGSRDAAAGTFHTGAFRLAIEAGVPVVPVALRGTADVLPRQGRVRRSHVDVRIGTAFIPTDAASSARLAHDRVETLTAQLPTDAPSVQEHIRRFATSPYAPGLAFVWAIAEALSWPVLTELLLCMLLLAAPRRFALLAGAAAAGTVVGGLIGFELARRGVTLPQPWTTLRMHTFVAGQTARHGAAAVSRQALSGIPFKVYVTSAAHDHAVSLWSFITTAAPIRAARITAVALTAALIGLTGRRWARWLPLVLTVGIVLFFTGLAVVVHLWS